MNNQAKHSDNQESAVRLYKALSMFQELQNGIEVQAIMAFLLIAKHHPEPCPMREIQDTLDIARAATSRNVAKLTDVDWRGGPGLDLVLNEINSDDSRCRDCRLNKKGQALFKRITDAIAGDNHS